MAEQHTPLPWAFSPWHIEEGPSAVRAPAGHLVTTTASDADAAYIVKACNAFPDLVKTLESIVVAERQFRDAMGDHWEGDPLSDAIDAGSRILSRVKGPSHP
jgi:hypothetical protein